MLRRRRDTVLEDAVRRDIPALRAQVEQNADDLDGYAARSQREDDQIVRRLERLEERVDAAIADLNRQVSERLDALTQQLITFVRAQPLQPLAAPDPLDNELVEHAQFLAQSGDVDITELRQALSEAGLNADLVLAEAPK